MFMGNEIEPYRQLNMIAYDIIGARIRVVDQMALQLYEGLHKRQRCTACGGEGVVVTKLSNPEHDPDLEDIYVSSVCGCAKHVDELLLKFKAEYDLLSELDSADQKVASRAALIKNGLNGKPTPP